MKNESLAIISKEDISITKIKKFFDSIGTAKVKKYLIDSKKNDLSYLYRWPNNEEKTKRKSEFSRAY